MAKVIEYNHLVLPFEGKPLVVIPGWIGRGRHMDGSPSQYTPLVSGGAFVKFGEVIAMDFTGAHADTEQIVQAMAASLRSLTGRSLTILASSYGAMMAIYALSQLDDVPPVHLVAVDPPAGAKSLVQLNKLRVGGLSTRIGRLPEWLNRGLPQHAFDKAFCPGLADSDPIDIPTWWEADPEEYKERVRKAAFDGQQGFPVTLCLEQVAAMARADGLAEACTAVDSHHKVTRVVCTRDNQVVDPAVSDPFYSRYLPRAVRVEAPSNHCDYAQRAEFWVNTLWPLL